MINTGGTVSNSSLTVLTLKYKCLISIYSTQWIRMWSTDKRSWQPTQTGGGSPQSKCRCVKYACPIRSLIYLCRARRVKIYLISWFHRGGFPNNIYICIRVWNISKLNGKRCINGEYRRRSLKRRAHVGCTYPCCLWRRGASRVVGRLHACVDQGADRLGQRWSSYCG